MDGSCATEENHVFGSPQFPFGFPFRLLALLLKAGRHVLGVASFGSHRVSASQAPQKPVPRFGWFISLPKLDPQPENWRCFGAEPRPSGVDVNRLGKF